jgi:ankyrin repeat protein
MQTASTALEQRALAAKLAKLLGAAKGHDAVAALGTCLVDGQPGVLALTPSAALICKAPPKGPVTELPLGDLTLDSLHPSCSCLTLGRASSGGRPTTLHFSSEKVRWVDALSAAVLGSAPPDEPFSAGGGVPWTHTRLLGSLCALASAGNAGRIAALLRAEASDADERPASPGSASGCDGDSVHGPAEVEVDAVDEVGSTALFYAVRGGHGGAVEALLSAGASLTALDADCNTPLHAAVMAGDAGTVKLLLANGAPTDSRNLLEYTPLGLCLATSSPPPSLRLVEALLEYGAEGSEADGEGLTPAHRLALLTTGPDLPPAAIAALVLCLTRRGADMCAVAVCRTREGGEEGLTPLHLAAGRRLDGDTREARVVDVDVLRALLDAGARPNSRIRGSGETALHVVARLMASCESQSTVEAQLLLVAAHTLVCHGARMQVPDGSGATPASIVAAVGGSAAHALEASEANWASAAPPHSAAAHVAAVIDSERGFTTIGASSLAAAAVPAAPKESGLSRFVNKLKRVGTDGASLAGASSMCAACEMDWAALACAWCEGPVCRACASKRFPLPRRASTASHDAGRDSDEEEGAGPAGAAKAAFSLFKNAVSTALAAPAAGNPAASSSGGGRRVCDSCFLRLSLLCEARGLEVREFEAQRAAHAATARNMREAAPAPAPARAARSAREAPPRVGELAAVMEGNRAAMGQRGERLSRLALATGEMAEDAGNFADAAAKLKAKYASPFGLW